MKRITRENIGEMSVEARAAIDDLFGGFDFEEGGWEFFPGQTIEGLQAAFEPWIDAEDVDWEDWEDYDEIPGHGVLWCM